LWLLLLTTGMRRGEALGLGWEHLDLDAARAAIRRNLTGARGRGEHRTAAWSEPKTAKSRRSVALDPGTVEALRVHRRGQAQEQLAWGRRTSAAVSCLRARTGPSSTRTG
jgi:integrase